MKPIEKFMFILIVVLISFLVYWFGIRINESRAIRIIASNTGKDATDLANFGEDYLISWAKSIRGNQKTFRLNGADFDSKTGVKLK